MREDTNEKGIEKRENTKERGGGKDTENTEGTDSFKNTSFR